MNKHIKIRVNEHIKTRVNHQITTRVNDYIKTRVNEQITAEDSRERRPHLVLIYGDSADVLYLIIAWEI